MTHQCLPGAGIWKSVFVIQAQHIAWLSNLVFFQISVVAPVTVRSPESLARFQKLPRYPVDAWLRTLKVHTCLMDWNNFDMRLVELTFSGSRMSHWLLEKAPINPSHGSHRHLTLEQGHPRESLDSKAQAISTLEKQFRVCIPITDRVNKLHSWNSRPLLEVQEEQCVDSKLFFKFLYV